MPLKKEMATSKNSCFFLMWYHLKDIKTNNRPLGRTTSVSLAILCRQDVVRIQFFFCFTCLACIPLFSIPHSSMKFGGFSPDNINWHTWCILFLFTVILTILLISFLPQNLLQVYFQYIFQIIFLSLHVSWLIKRIPLVIKA